LRVGIDDGGERQRESSGQIDCDFVKVPGQHVDGLIHHINGIGSPFRCHLFACNRKEQRKLMTRGTILIVDVVDEDGQEWVRGGRGRIQVEQGENPAKIQGSVLKIDVEDAEPTLGARESPCFPGNDRENALFEKLDSNRSDLLNVLLRERNNAKNVPAFG
jgi:hypothetical protein